MNVYFPRRALQRTPKMRRRGGESFGVQGLVTHGAWPLVRGCPQPGRRRLSTSPRARRSTRRGNRSPIDSTAAGSSGWLLANAHGPVCVCVCLCVCKIGRFEKRFAPPVCECECVFVCVWGGVCVWLCVTKNEQ